MVRIAHPTKKVILALCLLAGLTHAAFGSEPPAPPAAPVSFGLVQDVAVPIIKTTIRETYNFLKPSLISLVQKTHLSPEFASLIGIVLVCGGSLLMIRTILSNTPKIVASTAMIGVGAILLLASSGLGVQNGID